MLISSLDGVVGREGRKGRREGGREGGTEKREKWRIASRESCKREEKRGKKGREKRGTRNGWVENPLYGNKRERKVRKKGKKVAGLIFFFITLFRLLVYLFDGDL